MIRSATNRAPMAAILAGLCWAAVGFQLLAAPPGGPEQHPPAADSVLAGLPLLFEPNHGQAGAPASFVARGGNYQFLIAPAEAFLVLRKIGPVGPASPLERDQISAPQTLETRTVRIRFLQGDSRARISGSAELPGKINYLIGNDPARWQKGLSLYAKVRVEKLYPGIDVVYYGNQRRLEYDFEIAPRADPNAIALRFDGVDKVSISEQGELVLNLGTEEIRQPRPVIYQVVGGARKTIVGGYELLDSGAVTFALGRYDAELPLVIDPMLSYSSYFGGNSGDIALAIKLNANDGSIYIAGQTLSTGFPFDIPAGSYTTNFQGGTINGDAFVARLDSTLTNLVYFTYVGGSGNDGALDLAVDSAGDAYITGFTDSTNFPNPHAIYPSIGGTFDVSFKAFPTDAFVAELNPDGSDLVYSTYLGGSDAEVAGGIAVDPSGSAYVTGYTVSTNFPTTNALVFQLTGTTNARLDRLAGSRDAFVTKIASNGDALVYSTYLGGTNNDEGQGIVADAAGFAYVTGYTSSTNFPVVNALTNGIFLNGATNRPGSLDGFLAKIDPNGNTLDSSTYFGGTNSDAGFRITLDTAGVVYITGATSSGNFPKTTNIAGLRGGLDQTNQFNSDAFLTKFRYAGNSPTMIFSVSFGGTKNDVGWGVAVDAATNAYVIGITASTNFPVMNTSGFLRSSNAGSNDLYVTAFNAEGSALLYSAYLGGNGDDYGYGIAVDGAGNAFIAGRTLSTNFPVVNALQTSLDGSNDSIIAKISTQPLLRTMFQGPDMLVQWRAFAPEFHLESNAQPGTTNWTFLAPAPPPTNGWHTLRIGPTNAGDFFRLKL
jgi:hypothetical protein